jgi:hypothetical protein
MLSDFEVLQMNEFSDHMLLFFEFNFSVIHSRKSFPMIQKYIKWDATKNEQYFQILQAQQDRLVNIVSDLSCETDVHSAVRELTLTIYDSAFKVCGINFILIHDDKTSEITQNEWFDNKCIKDRAEFHYARNFFSRHSNEANRHLYVSARNRYNKVKRQATFSYKKKKRTRTL